MTLQLCSVYSSSINCGSQGDRLTETRIATFACMGYPSTSKLIRSGHRYILRLFISTAPARASIRSPLRSQPIISQHRPHEHLRSSRTILRRTILGRMVRHPVPTRHKDHGRGTALRRKDLRRRNHQPPPPHALSAPASPISYSRYRARRPRSSAASNPPFRWQKDSSRSPPHTQYNPDGTSSPH